MALHCKALHGSAGDWNGSSGAQGTATQSREPQSSGKAAKERQQRRGLESKVVHGSVRHWKGTPALDWKAGQSTALHWIALQGKGTPATESTTEHSKAVPRNAMHCRAVERRAPSSEGALFLAVNRRFDTQTPESKKDGIRQRQHQ